MYRISLLVSLISYVSISFGQFSWDNYKYIVLDDASAITIIGSGQESFTINHTFLIEDPLHAEFENFNSDITYKKQPSCLELNEEQFVYLNKFEMAVAFGKIYLLPGGNVRLDIFDAIGGWNSPVFSQLQGPMSPGAYNIQSKSAMKALALGVGRRPHKFNEASSNAYFNSSEIVATEFLANDPSRGGIATKEKIEYANILFQSKDVVTDIASVFILSSESKTCGGRETNSEGLSQIASLKLMPYFKVLDRSNLDAVLDEQKLNMSGITAESAVLSLGKIQGSEGIIFCQESCVSGQQMQSIKLLDCNTGEQQWIATGFGANPLNLMDAILQEIK